MFIVPEPTLLPCTAVPIVVRMLMRHLGGACVMLALAPAAAVLAQDPPRWVDGEIGKRVVGFLDAAAPYGFAGSVLVARGGKVVAALGVGHADLDGRQGVTANTLFEIASVTKQFTATAILLLVQQQRLNLDDPIGRHLSGIPAACDTITVRHLLQHTSGIPGTNSRGAGDDLAAVLPSFLAGGPRHQPGTHWEYWNQGYALLAAIVEATSGQGFTAFCKERMFVPAGLRTACFTGDAAPAGVGVAIGVSAKGEPRSALAHPYGSYGYQYRGMGGAVCSVWDLWHWDRALRGATVLADAARKELFTPGPGEYALGWFVRVEQGRKVQRHGGAVRGFLSEVRRWPDEDALLCVLCHRTDGPFGEVVQGLESILFGGRAVMPQPLPLAVGGELVGTWVEGDRRLIVRVAGVTLRAELHWGPEGPVTRGVLVGKDLEGLQFFDWREPTPLRVRRADKKAVALVLDRLVFTRE